jgi:putative membrane protein
LPWAAFYKFAAARDAPAPERADSLGMSLAFSRDMLRWTLTAAVLFGVGACAPPSRHEIETDFVEDAASRCTLELRLADQALSHATSENVRELAKAAIAEQKRARHELVLAAEQIDVHVPSGMIEEHREAFIRLAGLRGTSFDQAYAEAMVEQREEAVTALQEEVSRSETEVAKWAARTVPELSRALAQARDVAAETAGVAAADSAD